MRKFFSFRSSSASGGKENPLPRAPNDENVYWETPGEGVAGKTESSKASSSPRLRRSLSLSSTTSYGTWVDGKFDSGSDNANLSHIAAEDLTHCLPSTPERLPKSKRHSQGAIHKSHAFEKHDSRRSSRGHHGSTGNSPCSSPIPLRCRSSRVTQCLSTSNILDLYIDGEQHEGRTIKDSQPSLTGNDGYLAEKRTLPGFGRPPRAQYTATSSPTSSRESLRSCSFREDKNVTQNFSALDCSGDDFRPVSPRKHSRKNIESQSCAVYGKARTKVLDNESQTTTTTEGLYEDSSNSMMKTCAFSDHISADQQSHFQWDGPMGVMHESSLCLGRQDEDVDTELVRKLQETQKQIKKLQELDTDSDKLWSAKLCTSKLVNMIRNMTEEAKNLASDLCSQIHCRIYERASTMEALKQAKIDLDTRTRRLEKEKNELQSSLEKELDRRSTDWSFKLEKFQAEEQRLRERVRELAEHNVSLQREVSSLSVKEMEAQSRMMDSEAKLNEMTGRLDEMNHENDKLQQAFSELQEQCSTAEADKNCIKRNYREKEKEAKDLQKAVAKFQMICSEQEKTIAGLRQGYLDQIGKQPLEGGDPVSTLQMEHIRLTGVEQTLRKEVESFRVEVETLRHENIYILERLRCAGSGCNVSLFRVDHELQSQIECLQSRALSLLDEGNELCAKLLKVSNSKQCEHGHVAVCEFDGYSAVEYDMKLESLRRAIKNFRGRLQSTSETLDQRCKLMSMESQPQKISNGISRQSDGTSENELEIELKAEILVTRVLREKLFDKEQELEQLQSELGSSVCRNGILKSEIQRLQDELSCLVHKIKDMELQMLKKNENFNKLQHDFQECMKELMISRDILPRISEERDHLWEEMKQSQEINMLLDSEVKSLKKKVETLDEDILTKEGQISILKDSLGNKPFDILYSPNTMKELTLE